jgi:hypothetical protein
MNIQFPYYSGNIKLTNVLGHVSLERFIQSIKSPKQNMLELFNQISLEQDKAKRRELKWGLYSFTPSVMIDKGKKRRLDNVVYFNPVIQIDIDNLDSTNEAIRVKEELFDFDWCLTAFLSPSKKGVKGLMLVNQATSLLQFKAIYKSLLKNFERFKGLDFATKNAVLPLFLSYDKDILYRDIGDCAVYVDEDWSVDSGLSPTTSTTTIIYNKSEDRLKNRVLSNAQFSVENIVNNGHPQIMRAALIMGSRIAAGYIDQSTGTNHIVNLMQNNSYLKKNVKGYEKTILWGIEKGMANPIRFQDE